MEYIYKAVDFLKSPEKSFDSVKGKKIGEAFKFVLIVAVIFAVLNGVVAGLMLSYTPILAATLPLIVISVIVVSYIGIIIFLTIWGLWLHLWAYIFGARRGLEQTIKAVYYGNSPVYLLGWIPVILIISSIWSLVLQGIGLKKLQGMNTGKAASAMVIAIIIPLVIALTVFMTILATFMTMGGSFGGLGSLGPRMV